MESSFALVFRILYSSVSMLVSSTVFHYENILFHANQININLFLQLTNTNLDIQTLCYLLTQGTWCEIFVNIYVFYMGENVQFLDSFHICILVDDEGKCYSLEHVAECLLAPGFPPTADGRHISSDSPPPPSGVARRENAYHNRSPGTQIIQMCFLGQMFQM